MKIFFFLFLNKIISASAFLHWVIIIINNIIFLKWLCTVLQWLLLLLFHYPGLNGYVLKPAAYRNLDGTDGL